MRTTLTLDDDVLGAVKSLAKREHKTLGEVISALARQALRRYSVGKERNGMPLLSTQAQAEPVILALVNQLRDEMR